MATMHTDPAGGPGAATRPAWFAAEQLDRRRALGLPEGSLVVPIALDDRVPDPASTADAAAAGGYVAVTPAGSVVVLHGSGDADDWTNATLAEAVAEELGAAWTDVTVRAAPWGSCRMVGGAAGPAYVGRLRLAGARVREMLKGAAADAWGLPSTQGLAALGSTITDGLRARSFASLAASAAARAVPAAPGLLRPAASR